MIKEKKKISKYNFNKTRSQIIQEYVRTVVCSSLLAIVLTSFLAIHARNEMIKNISYVQENAHNIDKKLAQQIIENSNLTTDLESKKYSICLRAGELYETIGNYELAHYAYKLAVKKAPLGNYTPYYKLICLLSAQNKQEEALAILKNIPDVTSKKLIKFKTRSYIVIGDKYYSNGKFLSAAKNYEKANSYYNRFSKKDNKIVESLEYRLVNAYVQTADIMVKTGLNSDAVYFLKKAETHAPDDYNIKYKLAIILSDSNPEESVKYLDKLVKERPQDVDNRVYGNAFLKAANIADLDGRHTDAKYYRYKIHSMDLFVNNKVVYPNDIETNLLTFTIKKEFFTYPLELVYSFSNVSSVDIINLCADFVLTHNGNPVETITQTVASKDEPLLLYAEQPNTVQVEFKKKVFTRKELENYSIELYLYKDDKYKTLVDKIKIPTP